LTRASIFCHITILGVIKVRVVLLPYLIVENLEALSVLCKERIMRSAAFEVHQGTN